MRKQLSGLFIIFLLVLCGCETVCPLPAKTLKPKDETEEIEVLEITSFTFNHNGMSTWDIYSYSARQTEDGVHLYLELNAGNYILDVVVDEPVLKRLGEIAGKYRLDKWDGFNKANDYVLDGNGFSLFMTLSNGSTIKAQGTNSYPNGYSGAESEIYALFDELISTYGDAYPKTLLSDDLRDMYIKFTGEEGFGYRTFKFSANTQADGLIRLDIHIKGYEIWGNDPEYFFYGYCEKFPFDEVHSIVCKYDIPAWNGWERTAQNYLEREWFQIALSYAGSEHISAMGTLYPENYDEARDELLKLCVEFINENSESFLPWQG